MCTLATYSWQCLAAVRWVVVGLLLVGGLCGRAAAQARLRLQPAGRRQVRLPYQTQRNLIIVSARLNGQGPYNFVLDTGVDTSLLLDPTLGEQLHLVRGRRYRVMGMGADGQPLTAYQVDSVRVTLPGVEGPALSFLLLGPNDLNFSSYVGVPIHGILGADVFRSFVVAINPLSLTLVLHEPASFRAPRGRRWTTLPLALEGNKPYLTSRVTLRDTTTAALRLLLDTGAGHSLLLDMNTNPQLRLPHPCVSASLGRGLNGLITGHLGRTAALQLGRYSLAALITSFPDTSQARLASRDGFRNGSLGYEALSRFDAIIDYPHNQLLLKPNLRYRRPFEHDMSGVEVMAVGPDFRHYRVALVQAGSPAGIAGLQVNDEVLFVNFIPAASLSLSQINDLLRAAIGHQLSLVVRRADGELNHAVLRLTRQL